MESSPHVLQTGEFARSCLASEQQGRVLASFTKAVYLTTNAGRLFWLADSQVPMHRRCAALDRSLPKVAPGASYRIHGDVLTVDEDHEVELGAPPIWHAPLAPCPAPGGAIASAVLELLSRMDLRRATGFGSFLPRIVSATSPGVALPNTPFDDPILVWAEPLVLGIMRACMERQLNEMVEIADRLVGLGGGLTPSGDDFLGGLLFAIQALNSAYPGLSEPVHGMSMQRYVGRTHLISFTLLDDLAKGYAIAPMYELANCLIAGGYLPGTRRHALDLVRVGHSTGWDLLTGLLTGLLAGVRPDQPWAVPERAATIQV